MNALRWCLSAAVAVVAAAPATAAAARSPLRVSARPVPAQLTAKAVKTTVSVTNSGRRPLAGLTLSLRAAKGVQVTVAGARGGASRRALKPLRAGGTVRLAVTLRRSGRGRGPGRGSVAVTVARRGKALASARIRFGTRSGGGGQTRPAPEPTPPPNTLAGRYFWGSQYTINGIDQKTLWFTGDTLVFTGATESAWPTCTAVSEVCKPYSYDAATNALTIDGKPATLTGRRLVFDEDNYGEFGFPPAGSRWDTLVTYSNSSGICPLYCSYYTEELTFRPDGTFIRGAVSSGSGPIVDWAAVPADSKGGYEVRADRTLRLAFADGRERIETVALYLNDDGSLQPAGRGLLLGGDGYFDIRD